MATKTTELISLSEAARLVGLSSAAGIRYWALKGLLPITMVGRSPRVTRDDVIKANEEALKNPRRGKRGIRGRLVPVEADRERGGDGDRQSLEPAEHLPEG